MATPSSPKKPVWGSLSGSKGYVTALGKIAFGYDPAAVPARYTYDKKAWAAPPPPPKKWSISISDQMLASGQPSFADALVDEMVVRSQRELSGPVRVEARRDQSMRAMILTVTEIPSGIDVSDTDQVAGMIRTLLGVGPPSNVAPPATLSWASSASGTTTAPLTVVQLKAAFDKLVNAPVAPVPVWPTAATMIRAPELPDAPEPMWSPTPVYGFRRWSVSVGEEFNDRYREGGMIHVPPGVLIGNVEPWETTKLVAECRNTSLRNSSVMYGQAPEGHDAPHWGCHCGIYVCDDPNHTSVSALGHFNPDTYRYYPSEAVIGLVELTGTIVQHESGSRGQHGEIKHLWVTEGGHAKTVKEAYPELPLTVVPSRNTMLNLDPVSGVEAMTFEESKSVPIALDHRERPATNREFAEHWVQDMKHLKKRAEATWLK